MLRSIQKTTRLGILLLRHSPPKSPVGTSKSCAQVHSSGLRSKKMKKEWVQDQSQREVNAILASDKISGPTKQPLQLFTYDDEDLGTMKLFEARKLSEEKNLKLVPVDEKSDPMIYKLMDGKQLMEFNRHKKHDKKKPMKKLQLTLNISEHDLEMKLNHALDWLEHGHGVDVEVKSKRLAHDPEVGARQAEMFEKLTDAFGERAVVQQSTRTEASLRVVLVQKGDKTDH